MEQEFMSQTALDQMVGSDSGQMMKAVIPYLPPRGQQLLSVYAKTRELMNTLELFSPDNTDMQICAATASEPLEMLNDIRRFCYGESRRKLDQMVNMMAMVQMLQMMNQDTQGKEERHEQ